MIIRTDRLILRPFEPADYAPFARINADPEVMRYFPSTMSRKQSNELIARIEAGRKEKGFSFLAAEIAATGESIGMIGVGYLPEDVCAIAPGNARVEIGWRLARHVWGQGLAPEGALACLDYAFETLELPNVAAITFEGNSPSRRVMEKIGMTYLGDFSHPKLDPAHPIAPHVFYQIENPQA